MSWQHYVDIDLIRTGSVTQAGIYDLQGNPWAYSQNPPFAAQKAEVAAVSRHFSAPAGLAATGVVIAGVRYLYIRGTANDMIYVKNGNTGVYFFRCNTCIIVGYHDGSILPGDTMDAVTKLGDFFRKHACPPARPAHARPATTMPRPPLRPRLVPPAATARMCDCVRLCACARARVRWQGI